MAKKCATFVFVALIILSNTATAKDYWNWSEYGDYQLATCVVQSTDGSRGSGVQVQLGPYEVVLTAAHVVSGATQATCTFLDGKSFTGQVNYSRDYARSSTSQYDVAIVFVDHPGIPGLYIANESAKKGDIIEILSRGTSAKVIRHFLGTAMNATDFDIVVQNGDSGGGILNASHHVISVQSSGVHSPIARNDHRSLFRQAAGPNVTTIRDYLDRVLAKFPNCPDGVCAPQSQPQRAGGIVDYPPINRQGPVSPPRPVAPLPVAPVLPPVVSVPPVVLPVTPMVPVPKPQVIKIDYDMIAAAVLAKMGTDPRFKQAPITVGLLDRKGNIVSVIKQDANGTILLPPIHFQIQDKSGNIINNVQPIGNIIAIRAKQPN